MSTEEGRTGSEIEVEARPPNRYRSYWRVRFRLLGRLSLVLLTALFLGLFAVGVVRSVRMIGLPDVGDPFASLPPRPAAAAAASTPPPASGADPIALYRRAFGQLVNPTDRFSNSDRWLEANREPLALFRQAADCPRPARRPGSPVGQDEDGRVHEPHFDNLLRLALLEARRLDADDDMEGTWVWHRSALRANYQWGSQGALYGRYMTQHRRQPIASRIVGWSTDPRVKAPLLRKALDDVRACEALVVSDTEMLELGYRNLMKDFANGHWSRVRLASGVMPTLGNTGWELPPNLAGSWWQIERFLNSEPQRSERIVRLAFANWRAWVEQPDGRRPKPAIRAVLRIGKGRSQYVEFFTPAAGSAPAAQRMSPRRLAEWLGTTNDAAFPLSDFWSLFHTIRMQERAGQAALILQLAEQLYEREHGKPPPNNEALVGPYLTRIPDDGSSELDDGTVPTLETR